MTLQPTSAGELQDMMARGHSAIGVRGAGTKSPDAVGQTRTILDLRKLTGVTEYSPEECVFTALAGTSLSEINSQLAAHSQYLPFDPPLVDAGATIGGTVASGLSGSGRYRYGGVRDFLIGTRVVDGEGRLIRSGGKVVKNAAGFLLHHGMVGSLGRFGILTELTFKVFPSPEARATLQVYCESVSYAADTVRAVEAMRIDVEAIDFDDSGTLWIRVAGRAETIHARIERLQLAVPWPSEVLLGRWDEAIWTDAREFKWVPSGASLVKIPSALGDFASWRFGDLISRSRDCVSTARFTCGGSVAWAAVDDPAAFSTHLAEAKLRGLSLRGPQAGTLIGAITLNAFEERVRRVLDPHDRFSAASHPAR